MRLQSGLLATMVAASWLIPSPLLANPAQPPSKSVAATKPAESTTLVLPYAKAGLTKREAAVHLLNRFTFGPQNREADVLVYIGLENWLEEQLRADQPETELAKRLQAYPAMAMSDRDIANTYLEEGQMVDHAIAEGGFKRPPAKASPEAQKLFRDQAVMWAKQHGLKNIGDLRNVMQAQKLLRSVYAKNQLQEVLTDFWFNHFNVSVYTGARPYALGYERDAIRPNAMGPFLPLLLATAKHPAMLSYLNNAQSVANPDQPTSLELAEKKINKGRRAGKAGLNENYGREVMELHTLGVDGGYKQADVTEVARALTGWTVTPMYGPNRQKLEEGKVPGAIVQGDFLFRGEAHDAGAKNILGRQFPQGGGLEEGEAVLSMSAAHPSTAQFVSRAIAVRFVSDDPPESLVKRMAETFLRTGGDTRQVVRTMVQSPEFWAPEALGSKVKSPFELVASSLRAVDADVQPDGAAYYWVERMGQPLYAFAPPTGFPDRASMWVNSGTLTYRMNYGLTLASNRIKGLSVDLSMLEGLVRMSPERELERVAKILLPARDLKRTMAELGPLVGDPELADKVKRASEKSAMADPMMAASPAKPAPTKPSPAKPKPTAVPFSQVVGVLIGSPEFQRR